MSRNLFPFSEVYKVTLPGDSHVASLLRMTLNISLKCAILHCKTPNVISFRTKYYVIASAAGNLPKGIPYFKTPRKILLYPHYLSGSPRDTCTRGDKGANKHKSEHYRQRLLYIKSKILAQIRGSRGILVPALFIGDPAGYLYPRG